MYLKTLQYTKTDINLLTSFETKTENQEFTVLESVI